MPLWPAVCCCCLPVLPLDYLIGYQRPKELLRVKECLRKQDLSRNKYILHISIQLLYWYNTRCLMVVVAGAFGFPRKQVGPESFSTRHNIQQPPFLQQSSFIFQCITSQALEFQQSGAIDRNWPALLQGIHNTNASSQSQYSGGGTMPDSRDAFLSLWNPLCHLFLLFCLCFICALLLLHSYVHLLWCFQVKDEQDEIRQDDNRSSLPMPLSSCLNAPQMCC